MTGLSLSRPLHRRPAPAPAPFRAPTDQTNPISPSLRVCVTSAFTWLYEHPPAPRAPRPGAKRTHSHVPRPNPRARLSAPDHSPRYVIRTPQPGCPGDRLVHFRSPIRNPQSSIVNRQSTPSPRCLPAEPRLPFPREIQGADHDQTKPHSHTPMHRHTARLPRRGPRPVQAATQARTTTTANPPTR